MIVQAKLEQPWRNLCFHPYPLNFQGHADGGIQCINSMKGADVIFDFPGNPMPCEMTEAMEIHRLTLTLQTPLYHTDRGSPSIVHLHLDDVEILSREQSCTELCVVCLAAAKWCRPGQPDETRSNGRPCFRCAADRVQVLDSAGLNQKKWFAVAAWLAYARAHDPINWPDVCPNSGSGNSPIPVKLEVSR